MLSRSVAADGPEDIGAQSVRKSSLELLCTFLACYWLYGPNVDGHGSRVGYRHRCRQRYGHRYGHRHRYGHQHRYGHGHRYGHPTDSDTDTDPVALEASRSEMRVVPGEEHVTGFERGALPRFRATRCQGRRR